MDIVIAGHVDHGKSTVIGRLMADTGSLPEGKLEQVRAMCKRNARPFEYAFLLDALKNEQSQGITIDTARCFFKTPKRNYIIHDAPGHIEFLKNMVTGAARAQAALLVIDAAEGVQENSKRHGFMISMLGVKELSVLVNKMDLVDYREEVFDRIRSEYQEFLDRLGVHPRSFIPISARGGDNVATRSERFGWYTGPTVLEQVDAFERPSPRKDEYFRMPVQDIYKFTAEGDSRRIVAGTVFSGTVSAGDGVVFYPSMKESTVSSIEGFNTASATSVGAGVATGMTLTTQIYIKPGELMCKKGEPEPVVGRRFRANLFWMGRPPMVAGKVYKLKIGAASVPAELAEVKSVLDASELTTSQQKQQVDRHDVAECVIETLRPIAYDLRNDIEETGRFVIVDDYEIAGCGVILEDQQEDATVLKAQVQAREFSWEKGLVTPLDRATRFGNQGKLIVIHGVYGCGKRRLAKHLERKLFEAGYNTYYFGISNLFEELDHDFDNLEDDAHSQPMAREMDLERLGQLARVMTDAGVLLITTIAEGDDYDLENLRLLNAPNDPFVVNMGENVFSFYPVDVELPYRADLDTGTATVMAKMKEKGIFGE